MGHLSRRSVKAVKSGTTSLRSQLIKEAHRMMGEIEEHVTKHTLNIVKSVIELAFEEIVNTFEYNNKNDLIRLRRIKQRVLAKGQQKCSKVNPFEVGERKKKDEFKVKVFRVPREHVTVYSLFGRKTRLRFLEEHPDWTGKQITKKMQEEWEALKSNPTELISWETQAKATKELPPLKKAAGGVRKGRTPYHMFLAEKRPLIKKRLGVPPKKPEDKNDEDAMEEWREESKSYQKTVRDTLSAAWKLLNKQMEEGETKAIAEMQRLKKEAVEYVPSEKKKRIKKAAAFVEVSSSDDESSDEKKKNNGEDVEEKVEKAAEENVDTSSDEEEEKKIAAKPKPAAVKKMKFKKVEFSDSNTSSGDDSD